MKNSLIYLLFFGFITCKTEIVQTDSSRTETSPIPENASVSIKEVPAKPAEPNNSIAKKEKLTQATDDKVHLEDILISKKLYKQADDYILDYQYPYLNEEKESSFANFNEYIAENYLTTEATENEILEDKMLYCDSLGSRCIDKRVIDYKVYTTPDHLLSILLFRENYYSGMKHSTYMFECLNYHMDQYTFIYYHDFFQEDSEKELLTIMNKQITSAIKSGDFYYDCWELSEANFRGYKNNFVIKNQAIEFYFDDCVICPSYTGTYSVQIPIQKIIHLIKNQSTDVSLVTYPK